MLIVDSETKKCNVDFDCISDSDYAQVRIFTMFQETNFAMVLRLYGNSEIGGHAWSRLGYLICLRHLFIDRVQ